MSYSFTEKKRIRKSFANRPSVLAVPPCWIFSCGLMQISCRLMLSRMPCKDIGLQAAFTSIFPVSSTNGLPAFVLLVMTWLSQSLMLQSASSVV